MFEIKIAVAKSGEIISQHFGHCDGYAVYIVDGKQILEKGFLKYPGHKPGLLPKYLAENEVDLIIAGGMGASAQELFRQNRIKVIVGVAGTVEEIVRNYLAGAVESDNSICKN